MLRINHFEKKYGETLILSIPSLRFQHGIYWIRGENGSGKSSLFRSLAGIIPCKGDVMFDDGISLHGNPVEYRLNVNFSEAEPLFPGFLSARDIIHFVATSKKADKKQVDMLLRRFGVNAFLTRPTSTYSSGMLKRLSLCLAFIGNPRLIILDEPLITLDAEIRSVLFDHVRETLALRPVTFLISSHELFATDELPVTATLKITQKRIVE